jgi:hypothetical protein
MIKNDRTILYTNKTTVIEDAAWPYAGSACNGAVLNEKIAFRSVPYSSASVSSDVISNDTSNDV